MCSPGRLLQCELTWRQRQVAAQLVKLAERYCLVCGLNSLLEVIGRQATRDRVLTQFGDQQLAVVVGCPDP